MKTLILFLLLISTAQAGWIQNEDVKSQAEITGAGGLASQMVNSSKIWDDINACSLDTDITNFFPSQAGNSGKFMTTNGTSASWATVSVGVSVPGVIYTVSGSPTNNGTITLTANNQTANTVLAGPTSGGSASPTFRALVSADIPNNAANTTGTASNVTGVVAVANGGTGQTTFNAYLPILGSGGGVALSQGTVNSTNASTNFATAETAPWASGDCVEIDSHGNLEDTGFACGSGAGSVSSVSVVSANGFAGTVATATTTPAITMSTTVTGILYGNGTSVAAATNSQLPPPVPVNGGDTNYTILNTNKFIRSGTTLTAPRTYTLPACTAGNIGEEHKLKNIQTQTFNLTLAPNGSDTVDYQSNYVMAPGGAAPVICAVAGEWDIEQ